MSIIGDNCERIPDASSTSRDMDWDGSDQAGLAIPATANYTARSGDKLRANGDVQVLAHLRIYDGTVKMDCRGWSDRLADVTILPTPAANSASSPFSAPER